MIISASYKTDIPAFYSEWLSRRLAAGYCKVINPMNQKSGTVSLRRADVSGIVFWTRNVRPATGILKTLRSQGTPFYVQFTATSYPRALEPRVITWEDAVAQIRSISSQFGSDAVVWRYDPIIISDISDFDFHIKNFRKIASALSGVVNEVVTSFVHGYAKTQANLQKVHESRPLNWYDPDPRERQKLMVELLDIANKKQMQLSVCSQLASLVEGAHEAKCIDADRLSRCGDRVVVAPEKGNRPQCRCATSRDIGEYDTCPHGCAYCYAVRNRDRALRRFHEHDPHSEYLFARVQALQPEVPSLFPIM